MAPNSVAAPLERDPENVLKFPVSQTFPHNSVPEKNYHLQIFQSALNLIANILIGVTLGVVYFFAFRNGLPLGATPLHIVLCVTGYHLLMAQAILSLSPDNGWTSKLRLMDKRRAHWVLQIMGSGLAIIGSFIKIMDKEVHWNSFHGQFALVALVFTSISLVNGLVSLYATELRKFLNGNLVKLTHVCCGTIGFCSATICLCYGIEKSLFRSWATDPLAYTVITFVAVFAFIIIINPVITFYRKSMTVIKR